MPDEEREETQAEPEHAKPKPQPRKTVPVKTIAIEGQSILVEWVDNDDLWRCFLPAFEVANGKASKEALKAGAPYGIRWEDHLPTLPPTLAHVLAVELRKRGVWRGEDLQDVNSTRRAIAVMIGKIYTLLKQAAQEVDDENE